MWRFYVHQHAAASHTRRNHRTHDQAQLSRLNLGGGSIALCTPRLRTAVSSMETAPWFASGTTQLPNIERDSNPHPRGLDPTAHSQLCYSPILNNVCKNVANFF